LSELNHTDEVAKHLAIIHQVSNSKHFWNEVDKCNLICEPCHTEYSACQHNACEKMRLTKPDELDEESENEDELE
jgi:hypothetical protein